MALWCVGILKKYLKGKTVGYVLCDTESVTEGKDDNNKSCKKAMIKPVLSENVAAGLARGMKIENMEFQSGVLRINSGSENCYACYDVNTMKFLGIGDRGVKACQVNGIVKLPFVVVARDEKIGMHRCVMASGRIGDYPTVKIIEDCERGGRILSNASVVTESNTKFIRLKKGNIEHVDKIGEVKAAQAQARPVMEKPIQQTPIPVSPVEKPIQHEYNMDDLFEICEHEKYGYFIRRVKEVAVAKFAGLLDVNGNLKYPLVYNGKPVRYIEMTSMVGYNKHKVEEFIKTKEAWRTCIASRIPFDRSGRRGFICIEADDGKQRQKSHIETIDIENEKAIVSWELEYFSGSGILFVPHITRNGVVPTTIKKTLYAYEHVVVLLDNIKMAYSGAIRAGEAVDLSKSNLRFIPESFAKSSSIKWVEFNDYIERIHASAFAECLLLSEINIPLGLTEIANKAFEMTRLERITFKKGTKVKRIGARAFYGASLKEIDLSFIDGVISTSAFAHCKLKGELKVPGSVQHVGSRAFEGNIINRVTLMEGVEELGSSAFEYDAKGAIRHHLIEIDVPSTLKTVGKLSDCCCDYRINIYRGYASEQAWVLASSIAKTSEIQIVYLGDVESEELKLKESMLCMGGTMETLMNIADREFYGNDTFFTLSELLEM